MVKPDDIIGLVISIIAIFYLLAFTWAPLEDAGDVLQSSLGADITNEALFTGNGTGFGESNLDYLPVTAASETIYAAGVASTSWSNCSYTIEYGTGRVNISSTNGTANSCLNGAITADYSRNPDVDNVENISSLPSVAILLFGLLTTISVILMASRRVAL